MNRAMNRAPIRSQQGATLLVTLIMLIMLTLFAISAMNTSTTT
jgi:Tfp pilus assembly protein PilX